VVLVARDVTERTRAEAELSRQKASLEEQVQQRTFLVREVNEHLRRQSASLEAANAELSQFAHAVSHDIRAPLRAIRQYADYLAEDLGPALKGEQREYIDELHRSVRHAEDLVRDLLDLARLGHSPAAVARQSLAACVEETLATLEIGEGVVVEVPQSWPELEVDPRLLQQLLRNLVSNAVKFNRSSPKRVEVGWRQCEGEKAIEVFVRDNGIGIEERFFEKIFGVFERLHTKDEYEGTGIGLAIASKAAGKLGGAIRVESTPGKGSCFSVKLAHPS
jgi:signal transduction histidine kinase